MRRELLLIEEPIGAAELAHSLVAGVHLDDLEADRQRRDALLWNFTVLSEAAAQLDQDSSVDAGEALAAELPDACYVQGDISDPSTATAVVDAARTRWNRVFAVNVTGTFLITQAALPLLRQSTDGRVINITSTAGVGQIGNSLPCAVSKAAVDHLTTILAKHASDWVRVNAVAPGLVATPWTESWDDLKDGVSAAAPLPRIATPCDIADACEALISYATGQTLVVDGGLGLVL
jgi:ketoreductase RED2